MHEAGICQSWAKARDVWEVSERAGTSLERTWLWISVVQTEALEAWGLLATLDILALFFASFPRCVHSPAFLILFPLVETLGKKPVLRTLAFWFTASPARWLCKLCGVGEELCFLRGTA